MIIKLTTTITIKIIMILWEIELVNLQNVSENIIKKNYAIISTILLEFWFLFVVYFAFSIMFQTKFTSWLWYKVKIRFRQGSNKVKSRFYVFYLRIRFFIQEVQKVFLFKLLKTFFQHPVPIWRRFSNYAKTCDLKYL